MKAFFIFFLFASSSLLAQQTFTQVTDLKVKDGSFKVQKADFLSPSGAITYFEDRASFKAACTGSLVLEDFAGGPSDTTKATSCAGDISSLGNDCFPAGEIQAGIVLTSSNTNIPGNEYMVYSPKEFGADTIDAVGANQGESFVIVKFPDGNINRVGLNYSWVFSTSATFRIFGTSGLIDSVNLEDLPGAGAVFLGFIADEPITKIELEGNNYEFVGNIEFGVCEVVASEEVLGAHDVHIFPNPVGDLLTLKASENIVSLSILNTLGQQVKYARPLTNATDIDLSNLDSGVYFLSVQLKDKTGIYKVFKK